MSKGKKALGYVLWRGPSPIDGEPIVAIATGYGNKSENPKTGKMIQVWILREDMTPSAAAKCGADRSICGSCSHRGSVVDGKNVGRTCYVLEFQAPTTIWQTYRKGRYVDASAWDVRALEKIFYGRSIRLGAYGEPSLLPARLLAIITGVAKSWTGYTHRWREAGALLRELLMASCDTELDSYQAKLAGWRTFRAGEGQLKGEIACPGVTGKSTCERCGLCAGASRRARNVCVPLHGNRINSVRKRARKLPLVA